MSKTKLKLAEALKKLAGTKNLKKITIQDIVEESGMTRQSFYYHFHDIYEIIEWMCKNDLLKECEVTEDAPDEWICRMFVNMNESRKFYRKVISELGREIIERAMEEEVRVRISRTFQLMGIEERQISSFLTVSITNYLILTAKDKKKEMYFEDVVYFVESFTGMMKDYNNAKTVVKYA